MGRENAQNWGKTWLDDLRIAHEQMITQPQLDDRYRVPTKKCRIWSDNPNNLFFYGFQSTLKTMGFYQSYFFLNTPNIYFEQFNDTDLVHFDPEGGLDNMYPDLIRFRIRITRELNLRIQIYQSQGSRSRLKFQHSNLRMRSI